MKYIIVFVLSGLLLAACSQQTRKPKISKKDYHKQTQLMVQVCTKLANEQNALDLHKAAVSVQQARLISCSDVVNECSTYGKFLSLAAEVSKDGSLSYDDRQELGHQLLKLKKAIQKGRDKLNSVSEN